jgi:NAD(P)H-hydrate epimerase
MRALEDTAVAAGTSLDELMEAAGLAVAQEVWLMLGVVAGRRILVLAGPGNNGADGLVAARHLAEWEADVVVYLPLPRGEGDARVASLRAAGVPVIGAASDPGYAKLDDAIAGAEVIVDALLGTGRSRPIEGALADVLERLPRDAGASAAPHVVAVDLPTGVDADTGRADPLAVRAATTVTFGLAKVGLYALPGSGLAGSVQVVDIGLPKEAVRDAGVELLATPWVRERLPARDRGGNKGTFGRVLVVAGSDSYAGAAQLASAACYRAGAGLVTLACSPRLQAMVAPALAEATYLLSESRVAAPVIDALAASDALLIGPGLGQADEARAFVHDVLRAAPATIRACVVDADALNALARADGWSTTLARPCVLTPHPGEMSRLLGITVDEVQRDRLRVAAAAAERWGQVVVLKGAHTVVAAPNGRVAVSPHANALLAVAGTGDVLAGAVAGLIAQGVEPFEAAACGVYIHGMAAEELRDELGDRGLLAGDLLPMLPRVIRIIREGRALSAAPQVAGIPDPLALFEAARPDSPMPP